MPRRSPLLPYLLGARQTGKTTLASLIASRCQPVRYFYLDRAPDRTALSTPEQTLGTLDGLVVLDEIQRLPELFSVLRPLVDRPENSARFLLLGSLCATSWTGGGFGDLLLSLGGGFVCRGGALGVGALRGVRCQAGT